MIDGNDRSISFVITTIVRGMAIMAKNGVDVMNAEYIRPERKVLGAAMIKVIHRIRKTPKIPSWALYVLTNLLKLNGNL
jgi:hypothetical protein